jgi:hypothetical protein
MTLKGVSRRSHLAHRYFQMGRNKPPRRQGLVLTSQPGRKYLAPYFTHNAANSGRLVVGFFVRLWRSHAQKRQRQVCPRSKATDAALLCYVIYLPSPNRSTVAVSMFIESHQSHHPN